MNKKISILLLLALVISVGSVYATWGYAQGAIGNAIASLDVGEGKNIYITGANSDSKAGTITIDTSATTIVIDDANNDHVADLTYSGDIVITFVPSPGADADVMDGITLNLVGTTTAGWEYGGKAIFALDPQYATQSLSGAEMTEAGQIYTIPATEWQNWFVFNGGEDLVLDSMEDYDNFHDALHKGMITLTVSAAE